MITFRSVEKIQFFWFWGQEQAVHSGKAIDFGEKYESRKRKGEEKREGGRKKLRKLQLTKVHSVASLLNTRIRTETYNKWIMYYILYYLHVSALIRISYTGLKRFLYVQKYSSHSYEFVTCGDILYSLRSLERRAIQLRNSSLASALFSWNLGRTFK